MILIKNWKFPLSLFLDRIDLEIIFDDHLVKKKPSYTFFDFRQSPLLTFSKELTHDFDQKLKISSLLVSGQNRPWRYTTSPLRL